MIEELKGANKKNGKLSIFILFILKYSKIRDIKRLKNGLQRRSSSNLIPFSSFLILIGLSIIAHLLRSIYKQKQSF